MLVDSWHYHPMGLFILALFAFTAMQSLLPRVLRDRLAEEMQARRNTAHGFYVAFVIVFVAFGIIRALLHWAGV